MIELVLRLGVFRVPQIAGFFVFPHAAQDADHFRGDAHGNLDDRFVGGLAGFLRQVAGDRVLVPLNRPFIWAVLVENHPEQGGFAGAIGADEGHAFAPVDG